MEWCEIRVSTEEPCAEIIAGLFHEWGAGGVIIKDPYAVRRHIAEGIWDAHGFEQEYLERNGLVVRAFYPEPFRPSPQQIENLKDIAGNTCQIEVLTVRDEDWADNWKAYYHTNRVGRSLVIKPSWESYEGKPGDLVIEIDPGMAFGTGTHITTRQCLEIMETSLIPGQKVLDIGTGSGILAIAAARLGAAEVVAIDNDPLAVTIARRNVKQNEVARQVKVEQQDLALFRGIEMDLLLANLTAPVLSQLMEQLISLVRPGGRIIAAGIGGEQWPQLQTTMEQKGLRVEILNQEEDWVAVLARR